MIVSSAVRRWLADPRVRAVVVFVLVLMALALAWHLVGMADHSAEMGMLGGACLAVLVLGVLILLLPPVSLPVAVPAAEPVVTVASRRLPARFGRHPPRKGVVLLM